MGKGIMYLGEYFQSEDDREIEVDPTEEDSSLREGPRYEDKFYLFD